MARSFLASVTLVLVLLLGCVQVALAQRVIQNSEEALASVLGMFVDDPALVLLSTSPRLARNESSAVCPCSPSGAGHPPLDDPEVKELIARRKDFNDEKRGSLFRQSKKRKLERVMDKLRKRFGNEGYTNLDAALRGKIAKVHCFYDRETGLNIFPALTAKSPKPFVMVSVKPCDQIQLPGYRVPPAEKKLFVPSPGPTPAKRNYAAVSKKKALKLAFAAKPVVPTKPKKTTPLEKTSQPKPRGDGPDGLVMPSPEDVPGATPEPAQKPRKSPELKMPVTVVVDSPAPESPAPKPPAPQETPFSFPPSPTTEPRNEGCVAVEHLHGVGTQHGTPWLRETLCARGFCATPNHALLVDGRWTSMRRLCGSEWTCSRETRLVNNLKIASATRWRFDDRIVITPYDDRFPRVASWVVQMVEDVLTLSAAALVGGTVAACVVLVYSFALRDAVTRPLPVESVLRSSSEKMPRTCLREEPVVQYMVPALAAAS